MWWIFTLPQPSIYPISYFDNLQYSQKMFVISLAYTHRQLDKQHVTWLIGYSPPPSPSPIHPCPAHHTQLFTAVLNLLLCTIIHLRFLSLIPCTQVYRTLQFNCIAPYFAAWACKLKPYMFLLTVVLQFCVGPFDHTPSLLASFRVQ